MTSRMIVWLAIALITWPSVALAQSSSKVVGWLTPGYKDNSFSGIGVVVSELTRLGFIKGKNLIVEERYANGDMGRLASLAKELAATRPDVIIAVSELAIQAARDAAPSVPIVMAFSGSDPVALGFVASLSRPGGLITGLVLLAPEMEAKRIELAAQAVPGTKRIGLLLSPFAAAERVALAQQTAEAAGLELVLVRGKDSSEYNEAFKTLANSNASMLVVGSSPVFFRDAPELIARSAVLRLPLACEWREMARQGCLISYGPNLQKLFEKAAGYAGRVLQGSNPSELPVEQPTAIELVINMKAAGLLGVAMPTSFVARADEVIE
jgi:ABC-type uncharacterized transport system substrate-binding protein